MTIRLITVDALVCYAIRSEMHRLKRARVNTVGSLRHRRMTP